MAIARDQATRAYIRRFVPTMAIYVVAVFLAPALIRATDAHGPALWLLAVLPALPIIAVFWLIGRYWVELRDEYVRILEVRKALVATAFALVLATAWGFLEIYANAPHVPTFFVPVTWFAGLVVGSLVNRLIERGAAA